LELEIFKAAKKRNYSPALTLTNAMDIKQIFTQFETYQANKKRARGYS
jgi:hypothetical protein